MNIKKAFRELIEFLMSDKIPQDKTFPLVINEFLLKLAKEVNMENYKRFDKNIGMTLYNKVKETFDAFISEIGFKCLRCEKSCCYFTEGENLHDFDIYSEDIELIRKVDKDLAGIDNFSNKAMFFKDPEVMKSQDVFTNEEIEKIKVNMMKMLGYEKNMKIIQINGKYQCYYYDQKTQSCTIHDYKPLVCYTFPYRIVNNETKAGLMYCGDCNFNDKNYTHKSFHEKALFLTTYYEYLLAVSLFLRYKERIIIKENGLVEPDLRKVKEYVDGLLKIRQERLKEKEG